MNCSNINHPRKFYLVQTAAAKETENVVPISSAAGSDATAVEFGTAVGGKETSKAEVSKEEARASEDWKEEEPEYDDNLCILDWCKLNFKSLIGLVV